MKISRFLSVVWLLLFIFSCSGKTPIRPTGAFSPEKFFIKANKLIDDKEYEKARATLLEIKNRDLSKKYAPLAQLKIADSYIKEEELEHGVEEFRRFLEIYPDHRHAPYAQYQIAMVYYNQIESPDRGYSGKVQKHNSRL
jgi:outer membrane protein assembly factor BamD